jgi:spore maturation protein SpmA
VNTLFLAFFALAFGVAGYRQLVGGDGQVMAALGKSIIDNAAGAVTLAFGLIGVMALFLGLLRIAEAGGMLGALARAVQPVLRRLFPDVPKDHPAMGGMVLNISANMLGLGNAATPFGIRAMQALDTLNPARGTATNAMVMFLAINTSSVTLLPTSVIALRAAAGSADPAGVVPTTLFATVCSTAVAIVTAKLGQWLWREDPGGRTTDVEPQLLPALPADEPSDPAIAAAAAAPVAALSGDAPRWVAFGLLAAVLALVPAMIVYGEAIGSWVLPGLVVGFVAFGACRRVKVYEAFVDGARQGFDVAVRILPYLVSILIAIGMLRASGATDLLLDPVSRFTAPFGLPAEALLMALLRALTGSGAYAYLAAVLNDPAIGPDSYTGYLVSTIQGSTETTFYVLAVYFGAVGVRRIRHALVAGLAADAAALVASVLICSTLHG